MYPQVITIKVLSQVIYNPLNNNQKFSHITYFRTSLLKSGQLITSNQDKQSNIFSAQRLVRPIRKT